MALVQIAARQNRSGRAQTAWRAIPQGTDAAYMQLDVDQSSGDFMDEAERLDFRIQWSPNGGTTAQDLASGTFMGGPIETKSGVLYIEVPIPSGATHMRAGYQVVAGAPIRFGVLAEWR